MKTLMVPVDFSDVSEKQLRAVNALVDPEGGAVEVFHVLNPFPGYMGYGADIGSAPMSEEEQLKGLQEAADLLRKYVDKPEVTFSSALIKGEVIPKILAEIESRKADIVVMGSHGHGALYDLMIGSTLEGVLHRCARPVLIVPSQGEGEPLSKIKSIMVSVDFSDVSQELLRWASQIAQLHGSEVHLVHVHIPATELAEGPAITSGLMLEVDETQIEQAKTALEKLRKDVRIDEAHVHTHVRCGHVTHELLNLQDEHKPDITIMGSHGHGAAYNLLVGSATQGVLHKTHLPVLVIPQSTS
ncbi:MAG: nucleotide-binding universal stress UspA family protein [Kiritimatiellia bacterium]|jgi:nucleotide-binding universal stress UspA family protein